MPHLTLQKRQGRTPIPYKAISSSEISQTIDVIQRFVA
jgi:hypothetical protein